MDNKFRNHPSLMLEQLGVFGVIIITFLISSSYNQVFFIENSGFLNLFISANKP